MDTEIIVTLDEIMSEEFTEYPPCYFHLVEYGTIKFFDRRLGYGFLVTEEGEDAFVHHSEVVGQKQIKKFFEPGTRVSFYTEEGPKGLLAKSVRAEP